MRRLAWQDEDGVYAIELLGLFVLFAMIALFAFQIAAIGGAATMAENAARAGSRAAGLGQDAAAAAMAAIDPGSRDRARLCGSGSGGEVVTVCIDVPVVIPLVDLEVTTVERSARLPAAGLGRG